MNLELITIVISAATALVTAWNAYRSLYLGKMIAELKLNLMIELNGRYTRLASFEDAKERLRRLEAEADARHREE